MREARALVAVLALALSACGARLTHYAGYRGDGTFTPHAAPSAVCTDGYTVDLGAIDLSVAGAYDFTLAGLPPMDAVIGIALTRRAANGDSYVPRPNANIELSLRAASGRIVLARSESLAAWTARTAPSDPNSLRLDRPGTEAEIPVAPGAARVERFPLGPDDSWGTYFTPPRDARYALHFAVVAPDPALHDVDAHLQVNGVVGCL